ncbi:hypothetical protein L210DRAFT_3556204 [Boletus edulis BED1]|uniref:Uncharacterized protein n=1 Tax=Boletus edulis BED1 TaxID=1328754 RepID=A0AAD4BKA2_BOLED|nr:hypothetical protein L210DRAFT_3556204 [Boletus edulis BED1]
MDVIPPATYIFAPLVVDISFWVESCSHDCSEGGRCDSERGIVTCCGVSLLPSFASRRDRRSSSVSRISSSLASTPLAMVSALSKRVNSSESSAWISSLSSTKELNNLTSSSTLTISVAT